MYKLDDFYREYVFCYYDLRKILMFAGRPVPPLDDAWEQNYRAANYGLTEENVPLHRSKRKRPRKHEDKAAAPPAPVPAGP